MSYRGPALTYQIRKTTINNKSGDNYAITIPRIIAQKFKDYFFKLEVSGNSIIFTSGCKLSINNTDVNDEKKIYTAGGMISFP